MAAPGAGPKGQHTARIDLDAPSDPGSTSKEPGTIIRDLNGLEFEDSQVGKAGDAEQAAPSLVPPNLAGVRLSPGIAPPQASYVAQSPFFYAHL